MKKIRASINRLIFQNPIVNRYSIIFRELPADLRGKWPAYHAAFILQQHLQNAEHSSIEYKIRHEKRYSAPFFLLFLARSQLLQNDSSNALITINHFLQKYPKHTDANYLYAEILALDEKKDEAWQVLENLLTHTKRRKTWQHLSNLVNDKASFDRYLTLLTFYYPQWNESPLTYDLTTHLANAAQRAGCIDFSLNLWKTYYYKQLKDEFPQPIIQLNLSKKRYTDLLAERALGDLKVCLDKENIIFFLISGTLLGCIREGKLLGHDKDIDIGVWENNNIKQLSHIFRNSGCFYVLPHHSEEILVVRHVNGITIDIFIHHRTPNDYWHAGGKSKWHNTPFDLIPHQFLGASYLIPKTYDRYLTENYGDWHTPKINFDSALDTPNMEVIDNKAMLIYLYKKLSHKNTLNPNLRLRLKQALNHYETISH